jgi:anti-sigma regulatory factor (Ser/Thr protein kinase)
VSPREQREEFPNCRAALEDNLLTTSSFSGIMELSTKDDAMTSDLKTLILSALKKRKTLRTSDIVKSTGFSRAYVHRHLKMLQDAGRIVLIGRADQAHYVLATLKAREKAKALKRHFIRVYRNADLQEDRVWQQIVSQTGIVLGVRENVMRIVEYGFTEMLNNAIEHSRSQDVRVRARRTDEGIGFSVIDKGIGIFRNIKEQRGLRDETEAIQDLLKGKQSTDPQRHSGEGIFFTSRAADLLVIKSALKRLIFDNRIHDVTIDKTTVKKGTAVDFFISLKSRTALSSVFRQFSGDEYEFSKTDVRIALYKAGASFISRSQARRVVAGLDAFKHLVLDFANVQRIGQGFADEIFRVWKGSHPGVVIEVRNANEYVEMMIAHTRTAKPDLPLQTTC